MLKLIQVTSDEQMTAVHPLFSGYAKFFCENTAQIFGITVDFDDVLQRFMTGVENFYPPQGRFYLAEYNGEIAGVGCLKILGDNFGEIKRMFVQPELRGKGIGKRILDQLITDARTKGLTKIRLDSPKFSTISHGLYQSRGFQYIQPYQGSEVATWAEYFVFMELVL
jgi:N-acetylglutamate synthase-like GNAT family acetyltransferase